MMRTIATRLVCWMMLMSLAVVFYPPRGAAGSGRRRQGDPEKGLGREGTPSAGAPSAGGQRKAA